MTSPAPINGTELTGCDPKIPWDRIERFIGQFAHDVRNGLNALELQLTFLGEISSDPEAADEVKRIRGSLAEITRQLQAIRVSIVAVSPHVFEYPAADFFEDLKERFERNKIMGSERLDWRIDVSNALLVIDPELTLAAFLELLTNAMHFGQAKSLVVFEAVVEGARVVTRLREPCPAPPTIDVASWGRTPFQSTRRAAYGLGLFRVRRIIEAQGGDYDVEYAAQKEELVSRLTFSLAGKS